MKIILTSVGETRNIMNIDDGTCIASQYKELNHSIVKGALERRKLPEKLRNLYIFQSKRD